MKGTLLRLMLLLALGVAHSTAKGENKVEPANETYVVITVVGLTTLSVLIILIPSIIYYKMSGAKESEDEVE